MLSYVTAFDLAHVPGHWKDEPVALRHRSVEVVRPQMEPVPVFERASMLVCVYRFIPSSPTVNTFVDAYLCLPIV